MTAGFLGKMSLSFGDVPNKLGKETVLVRDIQVQVLCYTVLGGKFLHIKNENEKATEGISVGN